MILLPESILFLIWMLLNTVVISFFCVGWRAITDEGKIFYFLRKPFDMIEENENSNLSADLHTLEEIYSKRMADSSLVRSCAANEEYLINQNKLTKRYQRRIKIKQEIFKPIIGCVTCFASFWGTILFWTLSLFVSCSIVELLVAWPIVCIGSAFMNQYLWTKIE